MPRVKKLIDALRLTRHPSSNASSKKLSNVVRSDRIGVRWRESERRTACVSSKLSAVVSGMPRRMKRSRTQHRAQAKRHSFGEVLTVALWVE